MLRSFFKRVFGTKVLRLFYHKRKLIIRAEFDKYLEEHPEEKEQLKKCQRTSKEGVTQNDEFCEVAKASGLTESTSSNTW